MYDLTVEIIKETSFIYRICISYNPVMLILANILLCVTFRKKSLFYEKIAHTSLDILPMMRGKIYQDTPLKCQYSYEE